jgi:hypothetical protein
MSEITIPQYTTQSQTTPQAQLELNLIIKDGYHFNDAIGEYEVWLDGQIINYAFHQSTALFMYNEAKATRRTHSQRCPADVV